MRKGVCLRTHKKVDKTLLTSQGMISYSRYILRPSNSVSKQLLYENYGMKSVAPLDCALGIDCLPFKITVEMMLEIAYLAVKMGSYEDAEEMLFRTKKIKVNDDTIREVTNYIGKIIYDYDCKLADKSIKSLDSTAMSYPKDKDDVLYIEADGAAVNTRTKDENGSSWRECKLGLVFSSDHIRYWHNAHGKLQHQVLQKEYISLIGTVDEFKKHLFALAVRNGLGRYRNTVIISDGATWIRNMKEELFPDAQQILDIYHAFENIHTFSKFVFNNEETSKEWAEKICTLLENGQKNLMFKELEKYKDVKVPNGIVNIYGYLKNNENNIDYPKYKELGYFIGDGAIESGNKIVMQERLKLSGMRWNVETAQFILSLKAKMESGLWDSWVAPLVRNEMYHQA